MNLAPAIAVGKIAFRVGVKVRTIIISFLLGGVVVAWLMDAWAYTLAFATPQAIALLEWVQGR